MSPIGKIFAVINVILAAAFLGWASNALATSGQFKQKLADAEKAHASDTQLWEEERAGLSTKVSELESARASFSQQKDEAQGTAERYKGDLATEEQKNSELRASVDKIQGDLGNLVANNKALEEAKARATEGQNAAERERDGAVQAQAEAEAAQREAEQKFAARERDVASLETQIQGLNGDLASLQAKFETLSEMTGASLDKVLAMPLIEGRVLEVNGSIEPGLVALNVGQDAGVQRGFTFQIYRGNEYLGEVRIENVRPTMSTALITRTFEGRSISQGDNATTRL